MINQQNWFKVIVVSQVATCLCIIQHSFIHSFGHFEFVYLFTCNKETLFVT